MVKRLEDVIAYSCYRHAPESFELFFGGEKVCLENHERSEMGNVLISKGKNELLIIVKRFFRSSTIFRMQEEKVFLGIRIKNSQEWIKATNRKVARYDMAEKLEVYKELKERLKEDVNRKRKRFEYSSNKDKTVVKIKDNEETEQETCYKETFNLSSMVHLSVNG